MRSNKRGRIRGELKRTRFNPVRHGYCAIGIVANSSSHPMGVHPLWLNGNGAVKPRAERDCSRLFYRSLPDGSGGGFATDLGSPPLKTRCRAGYPAPWQQRIRRSSSTAEHRFRKAGVKGSNPFFGFQGCAERVLFSQGGVTVRIPRIRPEIFGYSDTSGAKHRILAVWGVVLAIAAALLMVAGAGSMLLDSFRRGIDAGPQQLVYHTNHAAVLHACTDVLKDPQGAGFPTAQNGIFNLDGPQSGRGFRPIFLRRSRISISNS